MFRLVALFWQGWFRFFRLACCRLCPGIFRCSRASAWNNCAGARRLAPACSRPRWHSYAGFRWYSFGATASAVGVFLKQNRGYLTPVAGALILLFGLHLLGLLIKLSYRLGIALGAILVVLGAISLARHAPLFGGLGALHFFSLSIIGFFGPALARWLNRDVHLRSAGSQAGPWSGFLLGFAFAFGWTPCIGPILTTVLAMAAAADHVARGVLLLATYSAGLAVPFLLTALGIGQFLTFYQRFRKYLHAVEVFSGTLLLFIGGLIFFN